jgi:hypothetical protein
LIHNVNRSARSLRVIVFLTISTETLITAALDNVLIFLSFYLAGIGIGIGAFWAIVRAARPRKKAASITACQIR